MIMVEVKQVRSAGCFDDGHLDGVDDQLLVWGRYSSLDGSHVLAVVPPTP